MKYGVYVFKLSIGFFGAERKDEWDAQEEYSKEEWDELGEKEQCEILEEYMKESLAQYVEMSYESKG